MLKLSTNSANFIGRIFALFLNFFVIYILINHFLKDPKNEHVIFTINIIHFEFKSLYLIYFMIILFI
ncbi:hypothetical protein A0257_18940 [Hymenobacter psoromatis]|nr:hypothetical protein A0257_18940 [Hymenobacter psoromatis]